MLSNLACQFSKDMKRQKRFLKSDNFSTLYRASFNYIANPPMSNNAAMKNNAL